MPSHRTPRPTRGTPLVLGPQRAIVAPNARDPYGQPPTPLPAFPQRPGVPVSQPMAHAHNLGPVVINRDAPVRVFASWDEFAARRHATWRDEPGGLEAGDCYFGSYQGVDPHNMVAFWLTLPTADGGASSACIDIIPPGGQPPPKERPRWTWNGSTERPTLSPSIRHSSIEHGDYWHGFLTDGVLVGCKNERKPRA